MPEAVERDSEVEIGIGITPPVAGWHRSGSSYPGSRPDHCFHALCAPKRRISQPWFIPVAGALITLPRRLHRRQLNLLC